MSDLGAGGPIEIEGILEFVKQLADACGPSDRYGDGGLGAGRPNRPAGAATAEEVAAAARLRGVGLNPQNTRRPASASPAAIEAEYESALLVRLRLYLSLYEAMAHLDMAKPGVWGAGIPSK